MIDHWPVQPLEAWAQMVMDLAIMHMEQAVMHRQQLDQLQDQPKHQTKIWSPPGPGVDALGLLLLKLPAWTQWWPLQRTILQLGEVASGAAMTQPQGGGFRDNVLCLQITPSPLLFLPVPVATNTVAHLLGVTQTLGKECWRCGQDISTVRAHCSRSAVPCCKLSETLPWTRRDVQCTGKVPRRYTTVL